MNRYLFAALAATATMLVAAQSAFAFGPCCCFCQKGRCQVEVDVEEVEIKTLDCECEAICIPPLRFPWECGPLKKCGKVRMVKKLVSGEPKKCKECTYEWTAIVCCPDCRSKLRKCCGASGCGDSGCCESAGSCDAYIEMPCGDVPCCATEAVGSASLAQTQVPQPAGVEEVSATLPKVFVATNLPTKKVPVALVQALESASPEADGWVKVPKIATTALSVGNGMIE
ncbi:hypothetical protein SAMN06265222_106175 [Neorhodopirellula lusitana]|uniref:Uncharacterized protein n=1 Tax=Neorhodopirellula lusitana TaxID=445327 RepID=A0ABY1Q4Z1_9BACT|nr:hypothetical protein [Neorhodopirellula lusitana]SMP59161.1 hypothetical protein SAMN06265222_106175 [Neorhodopirellula lusitana]